MDPELLKDLSLLDKTIREENLNLKNRLLSIHKDSLFFQRIKSHFPNWEVLPNERCGLWYVPIKDYNNSVYFKSTDGHTNNWGFSTRRLNLQILSIGECIIVDSTRRGKLSPDSLSKTIPIWCSVLNNIIDPLTTYERELFLDESCVSNLEREMILERLNNEIEDEIKPYLSGILNLKVLKEMGMNKKFKPYFISPQSNLQMISQQVNSSIEKEEYTPILLVTCSEMLRDGEDKSNGFSYVQGAGDDHELWSMGLTPRNFWENQQLFSKSQLLKSSNIDIIQMIENLKRKEELIMDETEDNLFKIWDITPKLSFGSIRPNCELNYKPKSFEKVIVLEGSVKGECKGVIIFPLESNSKKSSKQLRLELPKIMLNLNSNERTLIVCSTGWDLSPCVSICYLLKLEGGNINKIKIRQKLMELIKINSQVNPQRVTLNSINSFLIK